MTEQEYLEERKKKIKDLYRKTNLLAFSVKRFNRWRRPEENSFSSHFDNAFDKFRFQLAIVTLASELNHFCGDQEIEMPALEAAKE